MMTTITIWSDSYHQWQAPLLLSWNQNVFDDIHLIFMMMIHNFNNDNDNDDNDNHLIWQLSPVASPSTPHPAPFPLMSIHSKGGDDDRDDDDHDYDDVLYSWIRKVSYPLQHFSHPGLHCQLWINILIILSIVCVVNFTGNTNITIKSMSIKIEEKSHHCSKYLSARKSCNPWTMG